MQHDLPRFDNRMSDAEALMHATAGDVTERAVKARTRAEESLRVAVDAFAGLAVVEQAVVVDADFGIFFVEWDFGRI